MKIERHTIKPGSVILLNCKKDKTLPTEKDSDRFADAFFADLISKLKSSLEASDVVFMYDNDYIEEIHILEPENVSPFKLETRKEADWPLPDADAPNYDDEFRKVPHTCYPSEKLGNNMCGCHGEITDKEMD